MKSGLHIGLTIPPGAAPVVLPIDWITAATVVYGARGVGKTTFGRVSAEEVFDLRQRFCAIDPKGDWWGLKASADGRGEGLPVLVIGGDHGDLPLEADAGEFIGRLVADLEISVVLDLELLSKGKQVRFIAEFLKALYHHNRRPLLLVVDEAQRFAPQRPITPDETICLGATEDIVKLGRKHGLGVLLLTQRGSGLNKEVGEICDMLAAMRTPGPLDQDRVKDWLDANRTKEERERIMGLLSSLPNGRAVLASAHPAMPIFAVVDIRTPRTFDSSATPRIGQRRITPKRLAQPDIEKIREQMAGAIERAKADDPKELRRKLAEANKDLTRTKLELAQKTVALSLAKGLKISKPMPVEVEKIVEVPDQQWARGLLAKLMEITQDFGRSIENLLEGALDEAKTKPKGARGIRPHPLPPPTRPPRVPAPGRTYDDGQGPDVTRPQQRILDALAWAESVGITLERDQLALIAGVSHKSSAYANNLGALRTGGYVTPGTPHLTDAGRAIANPPESTPTSEDVQRSVMARLTGPQRRLLQALLDAHPDGLDREDLARRGETTVTSSAFANNIGRLRSLGLATRGWPVVAADILFLEHRVA